MTMIFRCIYCNEPIHGVAAIHHGEFIHHRCAKAYNELKKEDMDAEKEEILTEE